MKELCKECGLAKPYCPCPPTIQEEKCYSCGGKGTYSQMTTEIGSEDFGGEGYQKAATIHNYPCKACNGTGLKPVIQQEGKKCFSCQYKLKNNHTCTASPEEAQEPEVMDYKPDDASQYPMVSSDWKEKEREAFSKEFGSTWEYDERIEDYWISRTEKLIEAERLAKLPEHSKAIKALIEAAREDEKRKVTQFYKTKKTGHLGREDMKKSFQAGRAAALEAVKKMLESMQETCRLILKIRMNH